jgi:hypothetical protein
MSKAQRFTKGVSPAGIAAYPFLNKPDEYKGKKQYKVTLRMGATESEAFRAKIQEETDKTEANVRAQLEERLADAKDGKTKAKVKTLMEELEVGMPFSEAVDDDGNPNGNYEFKFKCNAEFEDKKTGDMVQITVPLFDAKKKITKDSIWSGSKLKIAYALVPYFVEGAKTCGVSLRIEGVQIIELVSGTGGRSAAALGFGEEEGYAAEDDDVADTSLSAVGSGDEDF